RNEASTAPSSRRTLAVLTLTMTCLPLLVVMRRSMSFGKRPCRKAARRSWPRPSSSAAKMSLSGRPRRSFSSYPVISRALGFENDDAIGRALEEVGIALKRAHSALGLEAGDGDLLRLIAKRLQYTSVSQGDRHRARDGLTQRKLAPPERPLPLRTKEKHPHG